MGLIKAAISSAKTTLADQWLEYFYCDSLSDDVWLKKPVNVSMPEVTRKAVRMSSPMAAVLRSMKDSA